MPLADFEPQNDLEAAIADGHGGALPIEQVLGRLAVSPLAISSRTEVAADGSGFEPLLLDNDGQPLVAVFSSPDRPALHRAEAEYFVQMHARDFFLRMPPGYGVIVNPGYSAQFVIDADAVAGLRQQLGG